MAENVKTRCPGCGTILRISASVQTDTVRCTKCNTLMRIKRPSTNAPTPIPVPLSGPPTPVGPPMAPTVMPPVPAHPKMPGAGTPGSVPPPPQSLTPPPLAASPIPQGAQPTGPLIQVRPPKNDGWMGTAILFGLMVVLFVGIGALVAPKLFSGKTEGKGEPGAENGQNKAGGLGKAGALGGAFPRRALIFSIHNYLYANPVGNHAGSDQAAVAKLPEILSKGKLNLPREQVLWVSELDSKHPQPVLKPVFEKTLEGFLTESRPQDRVLVGFIGHAIAINNKAYLVPLEGELGTESTLIPLEWVYSKLKECKARQKVLVLDICRFNMGLGQERTGGEPMSKELATALATAPEGVEVLTSCKEGERSWETEADPAGLFLVTFCKVITDGLKGQIQKPTEPIPVERILKETKTALAQRGQEIGQTQTVSHFGTASEDEVEDSPEPAPKPKVVATEPPSALLVERTGQILKQIQLPPVKVTSADDQFDPRIIAALCDPNSKAIAEAGKIGAPPKNNKAYQFMEKVRAHLWRISARKPPEDLKTIVDQLKKREIKEDLNLLRGGFRAAEDAVLKKTVETNQRSVAQILGLLEDDLADLEKLGDDKDDLAPFWRANFDYVQAKLEAEAAFLWEYQSLLGQMRKEAPPRDPKIQGGWMLASNANPQGDSKGKKLAKSSKKIYETLSKKYPGTPWDIMSKREVGTALGLEWQAVP